MSAFTTQQAGIRQPRVVSRRPRHNRGLLGAIAFIASESMFFSGLFLAYFFLRTDTTLTIRSDQPLHPSVVLPLVNTLILTVSVAAIAWAERSIARGIQRNLILGLTVAAALGLVFMLLQSVEFSRFITEGFTPNSSAFGSTFFALLIFHVLRVFAGVTFMVIVLVRAFMGQFNQTRRAAVQACAAYWYFIYIVWLLVFAVLYRS